LRLVVPYVGELRPLDARMLELARFLGLESETLPLTKVSDPVGYLKDVVPDRCSCFVVNPQAMKEWMGPETFPGGLVAFLLSRFSHLLVHGLGVDPFDSAMVAALSQGRLQSVDPIENKSANYEVSKDSRDICEAFSGLSFGPVNPANDHVFSTRASDPAVRHLISIAGRPFMAAVKPDSTGAAAPEVLFIASEDVVDLNEEVGGAPLAEYFSRFLPHAMALRYVACDECWRPDQHHASIIVDDPLLRKDYGFLNFDTLLRLTKRHNFHTTIAFIPHNFRRSSPRITRMFRENASRLSICFHGNDHTGAEFASTDTALLNTLLQVAERRMNLHQKTTSLPCDRVMVFPQGNFSLTAMKVLKSNNFDAGVNTVPHPVEQPVRLTIGELAQPAVLRYGGFPLFIRKPIGQTQTYDIAFNLFFGRPVLIVEHHEIFQHPESLIEVVARINAVAPEIHWSNLATVVSNSILARRESDGSFRVRAYSGTVQVSNGSPSIRRYSVDWAGSCDGASIERVTMDGAVGGGFEIDDAGPRLSIELTPGSSRRFSLVHRNNHAAVGSLGLRWNAQAFLRRRLSEIRDNYLSKSQPVLAAAKILQRRFLKV
jgi:hypothetical protein